MTKVARHATGGTVTALIGVLLWVFAGGVEVPVFELDKVGMVMVVVGIVEVAVTLVRGLGHRRA
ncbi:hypothetical protein SAMN06297387_115110 [Streptomyces zhaozhouensis]|uniref:Uncharacterized protein n=1 Tax=Streptomyces zhaozhouensis TaxID=1300267 RepID=A0A286E071_9ACTN|nr:DUF5708 family protein [Streptomyces zhaozhouensis]SOD64250.1 hypothetical protein SAMN06297387_115110 [Streptomyces zhaozhouensis]